MICVVTLFLYLCALLIKNLSYLISYGIIFCSIIPYRKEVFSVSSSSVLVRHFACFCLGSLLS